MSASMAEGMVEVILDHRVSRTGHCACGAVLFDMSPERVATHAAEVLAANGYGKLEEGCDRTANVPSEGFEFLPTCLGCGETLIHDYYHGELVYRHKETQ